MQSSNFMTLDFFLLYREKARHNIRYSKKQYEGIIVDLQHLSVKKRNSMTEVTLFPESMKLSVKNQLF